MNNTFLLYAIKDNLNGFATPIPHPNEGTAIRWFEEKMIRDPYFNFAPQDYELWYLGEFSPEEGEIIFDAALKKCIKKGAEYVRNDV